MTEHAQTQVLSFQGHTKIRSEPELVGSPYLADSCSMLYYCSNWPLHLTSYHLHFPDKETQFVVVNDDLPKVTH